MANTIQALMTNDGREALAKSFGGPSGSYLWSYGAYFKLGTGGWVSGISGREPQSPNASYSDILSGVSGVFWYKKSFVPADILFIAPYTIQFRCFVDLAEANGNSILEPDTGSSVDGPKLSSSLGGNAPIFFELGLFDVNNKMVAYGTFPGETKLNTKTLNHLVNINF